MVNYLNENFKYPAVTTYDSQKKAVGLACQVFFYVPAKGEGAVLWKRPDRHFKEIKGIRKLHCMRTTKQQGRVVVREQTCYCFACIKGDEKSCSNNGWLDDWNCIYIERESFATTTRRTAEETEAVQGDTAVRIADMAAADDPDYDYYLLKVTSYGVVELDEAMTDDYGSSFPKGSIGLRGNFYISENLIDVTYKLDETKSAFVLSAMIRHLCHKLKRKRKNIFQVPLIVKEEIIAFL